jgi:hypothetical protein
VHTNENRRKARSFNVSSAVRNQGYVAGEPSLELNRRVPVNLLHSAALTVMPWHPAFPGGTACSGTFHRF